MILWCRASAADNPRGYDLFRVSNEGRTERTHIGAWDIYPQGLTDILVELHQDYPLPPIYITENGAACDDVLEADQVNDEQRRRYFQGHLAAVDQAIEQGVDIRWLLRLVSLMDNFEWAFGYTHHSLWARLCGLRDAGPDPRKGFGYGLAIIFAERHRERPI